MDLAAESFQDKRIFMSQAWLTERITAFMRRLPHMHTAAIDSEAILRSIEAQHGLLIERAQKIYSFSHLTFQEYFAARYIVAQAKKEHYRYMTEQAHDDRWREVLQLTASMLDHSQAERFFLAWTDALQRLALSTPEISVFLTWAQAWSNKRGLDYGGRGEVVLISLIENFNIPIFDLASARTRDRARDRARTFAHALDRILDHIHALAILFANTFISIRVEDVVRARIYHRDRAKLRASACISATTNYIQFPERFGVELSFWLNMLANLDIIPSLYGQERDEIMTAINSSINSLTTIPREAILLHSLQHLMPIDTDSRAWQQYARHMRNLLIEQHNIGHRWVFGGQLDILNKYLASTLRLVECLKLASIDDREAVLNRLFTVPE